MKFIQISSSTITTAAGIALFLFALDDEGRLWVSSLASKFGTGGELSPSSGKWIRYDTEGE